MKMINLSPPPENMNSIREACSIIVTITISYFLMQRRMSNKLDVASEKQSNRTSEHSHCPKTDGLGDEFFWMSLHNHSCVGEVRSMAALWCRRRSHVGEVLTASVSQSNMTGEHIVTHSAGLGGGGMCAARRPEMNLKKKTLKWALEKHGICYGCRDNIHLNFSPRLKLRLCTYG